jgi:hypothetical protein
MNCEKCEKIKIPGGCLDCKYFREWCKNVGQSDNARQGTQKAIQQSKSSIQVMQESWQLPVVQGESET